MVRSGLQGPYPFTKAVIQTLVIDATDWSSAAVFALGTLRNNQFFIHRVGHADGDLAKELQKYFGQYKAFRFRFYRSTRIAYDKECRLYHEFNPKDNATHPIKPKNTKFKCPLPFCEYSE